MKTTAHLGRIGWHRHGRHYWSQYVGRGVKLLKSGVFVAWAGNNFCGLHNSLSEAQIAAEKKWG